MQGVIARSHCKELLQESLQEVIARSHCKESLQGVMTFIASCAWSQVQVASARSQAQAQLTCKELKILFLGPTTHTKIDPLRGSAWSRAKTHGFLQFLKFPRDPLQARRSRGAKIHGFLRFLKFPRNPLGRGWSGRPRLRCLLSGQPWSSFCTRALYP